MKTAAMTDKDLAPGPEKRESFLRIGKVMERTTMRKTSLYDEIKKGNFPPPIVLRRNIHVWLESDVDEYIRRKTEESRKGSRVFRATQSAR